MNNVIKSDFSEIYPIILEKLENGFEVSYTPSGISMLPTIIGSKDKVILKKPEFPLKKYDLVFYRRKNGVFVLHRIIKINKNEYTMCGDNQFVIEKGVEQERIFAVVKEIIKNGKYLSAKCFPSKLFCRTLFFRRFFLHGISFLKRVLKRILKK